MNQNTEKFIQDIAKQAGKVTLGFFKNAEVQYTKEHALDVVTQADLASNKFITEAIKKEFPNDGIISEETGESNTDAEYIWIIDPLDGTLNFSKNIPLYTILIARAKAGIVELAVIYDPIHDELCYAKRGEGAYLNGERIKCTEMKSLDDTVGCYTGKLRSTDIVRLEKMINANSKGNLSTTSFFGMGINTLYVAIGRRDWFIIEGGALWDHAAPSLILEESGCKVTSMTGTPWSFKDKTMLAANPELHGFILSKITE
jgi:myo-inositol-1(or 4)-monophosphatase